MKALTVKISENLFFEIAGEAKARNVSKSEVVRERLIRKPAKSKQTKGSLWNSMEDLVIISDSLPDDLSPNKANLKNYGKSRPH